MMTTSHADNDVGSEVSLGSGGVSNDSFVKTFFKFEAIVYGVLALLFIVVTLAGGMKAKSLFLILLSLFFLSAIVLGVVAFVDRKENKGSERIISMDEARVLAEGVIMSPFVAEYVDKIVDESVRSFGNKGSEQKVYVRKFLSYFENVTVVVLVNMSNKLTSFKFFDLADVDDNKFNKVINGLCNKLVSSPTEEGDTEEEVIDKPDGSRVVRKRSFKRQGGQVRVVEKMKEVK